MSDTFLYLPMQHENPNGLHVKYEIKKIVAISSNYPGHYKTIPVDEGSEYFVLRLDDNQSNKAHLNACKQAILAYANAIRQFNETLADDLLKRYFTTK